jgi:hypothetical protein
MTAVKHNVGTMDRVIRVLLGLGLLGAVFVVEGGARWLGLIGLIPLLTGIVGACPLYTLFGLSSCPIARAKM